MRRIWPVLKYFNCGESDRKLSLADEPITKSVCAGCRARQVGNISQRLRGVGLGKGRFGLRVRTDAYDERVSRWSLNLALADKRH
jgi:hypothetical protein